MNTGKWIAWVLVGLFALCSLAFCALGLAWLAVGPVVGAWLASWATAHGAESKLVNANLGFGGFAVFILCYVLAIVMAAVAVAMGRVATGGRV